MPDGLKKKIGPLPVWAWAIVAGVVIGGIILYTRGTSTTDQASDANTDFTPQVDPTTGLPYTGESSGGSISSGTAAPSLAQEISDTTGLISQLQGAGLWPSVATQGAASPSLVDLAPGHTYYDPTTGNTVSGPEQAAAKEAPKVTAKSTALDKAKAAVQKGRSTPFQRSVLKKAGYSSNQIAYHQKHKTPLQQPHTPVKTKTKATAAKVHAAPTHPLQHVTAAPPNHGKAKVHAGKK